MEHLSHEELLFIALESASHHALSQLLASYQLHALPRAHPGELQPVLGARTTRQLQAVLELARWLGMPAEPKQVIRYVADAAALVMEEMTALDHEQLRVLVLDSANQLLLNKVLYEGTVNSVVTRVAEVFRDAILRQGRSIILVHNHPSGLTRASSEDIAFTKQVIEAATLLDIDVLDHLIIGNHQYLSLQSQMRWLEHSEY